jgi:hypothetical protein
VCWLARSASLYQLVKAANSAVKASLLVLISSLEPETRCRMPWQPSLTGQHPTA